MKKILVPLDFSKASLNAFKYALHFAQKINAEILTIHVYETPKSGYLDFFGFLQENYGIAELAEFENYKSKVPKLWKIADKLQLAHIKVSHILQPGNAAGVIPDIAKKEQADYIVMGTNGASGLTEIFVGSVTEKVINNAPVPVLAIPPGCPFRAIRKILFLTKYDPAEVHQLEKVLRFASIFKAHTEALQIGHNHHDGELEMLKGLKGQFLKRDINFSILASNAVEETVLDFVELNKIDFIIMTVHHKNFIERLFAFSLASKMAFHTTVPILAFPLLKT